MEPPVVARKKTCYDFGLEVQALAAQLNQNNRASSPTQIASIQAISDTVLNAIPNEKWQNPVVGTACGSLALAVKKLPPSEMRDRVVNKLEGMQFPFPKDIIEMIVKAAVKKEASVLTLLRLMLVSRFFRTVVAKEITQPFRQLRAHGSLNENQFVFLDHVKDDFSLYLTLKKAITPYHTRQKVKNCSSIALPFLQMPGLTRLEWDVAYGSEGGLPLNLDTLEHANSGVTIIISHALIATIPNALREQALLTFDNNCIFSYGIQTPQFDLQPLTQRFSVVFQASKFKFAISDLNTIEPKTGIMLDPRVRLAEGVVTVAADSLYSVQNIDFIQLGVKQLIVNKARADQIPLPLLIKEGLTHLQWNTASSREELPLNLNTLFSAKKGMTIEIFNAYIPTIPECLQGIAVLTFFGCFFKEALASPLDDRVEPPQHLITVAFKQCLFDIPFSSIKIHCPPHGVVDLADDHLLHAQSLSKTPVQRLIVRQAKKFDTIPPFLFGLPHLMRIEWHVVQKKELLEIERLHDAKPGMNLEGLLDAKPGMTIEISNAYITAIPEKLRERATLAFLSSFFKGTLDHAVEGHLLPADPAKGFSIIFKECQFDFPFSNLRMVESTPGMIHRPKNPDTETGCKIS